MPKFMTIFGYNLYFWSNENTPLEPVHIHISKGTPIKDATKYWVNKNGKIKQENNNSQIPQKDLKKIEKVIKTYADDIVKEWEKYFGEKAKFHKSTINNQRDDR